MKQYVCSICGYVHDEAKNGPWEALPADWKCPICKADKSAFAAKQAAGAAEAVQALTAEKELSAMEISIICSNLARGCEKQYMAQQAEDFFQLAEVFRAKVEPAEQADYSKLLELIDKDLNSGYPYANAVAKENSDRGAQRALVWSEKVSRMLQSLLNRYAEEGDAMLEHTGVYVCTVCGFVYVGDSAPELCPVCKVPSWKFEQVKGSAE